MAKVLMAAVPAFGLATPALPFAQALVAAGHCVDFLTGEAFRGKVERTGATVIPFGTSEAITHPRQLALGGRRLFGEMNDQLRRRGPAYDVVIPAGINPGVRDLERSLDRPVAFLSPVFFQNDRVMAHLAAIGTSLPAPMRRVLGTPRLRRLAARIVGPAVLNAHPRDLLDLLRPQSSTLNISPASRYYQPFDEDFDDATCCFAGPTPTLTEPDPDFPLERLRQHPGRVIYATLGTVFNRHLDWFRAIAEAFRGSDALVVITTGRESSVAALGAVPGNVIVRSFVPQTDVLREADLCFTHGGFGSATDTVAMGVPAVLTPMGADQFFNAHRMQELGAGRVLAKRDVTPATVRAVADDVLAHGRTTGLERLRQSFLTAPGPAGAVARIEAVL